MINPIDLSNNQIIENNQTTSNDTQLEDIEVNDKIVVGNSTSVGDKNKAYELNKSSSVVKTVTPHINYYLILFLIIAIVSLIIGYKKEKSKNK